MMRNKFTAPSPRFSRQGKLNVAGVFGNFESLYKGNTVNNNMGVLYIIHGKYKCINLPKKFLKFNRF